MGRAPGNSAAEASAAAAATTSGPKSSRAAAAAAAAAAQQQNPAAAAESAAAAAASFKANGAGGADVSGGALSSDAMAALMAGDPASLAAPIKDAKDKWRLLPAFLQVRGLVRQHVESFNHFLRRDIEKIMSANERVSCDVDPNFYLKYLAIHVGEPCLEEEYRTERVTPQQCRLRDVTYAAPVSVDVEYTRGREIVRRTAAGGNPVRIGRIPLMLRCDKCVLAGKTDAELAALGECPLDPGGYFVVRGTEKVILIQEQLSKNRIIIDTDASGEPVASVTSSTHERKSKTNVLLRAGKFVLRHNAFADDVNAAVAMKAMGADSDQEVVALVGPEEALQALLLPTLQEARSLGVFTQQQALEHVASKLAQRGPPRAFAAERRRGGKSKVDEARDVLANVVLCHVPVVRYGFGAKLVYLAAMMRRVAAAALDRSFVDDRDYYGNKRLELAGGLMALLFEDLFKRLNADLKRQADIQMSKASRAGQFDVARQIRADTITLGLESAISSGNWHIKRFRMDRKGVTQVLSRLSFIASLGMMTRMSSQFEKTRKVSGPRALHPSQWGMLCPADTPEGESCGLVKNLALMTHVTTDQDEAPVARLCYALGVQPLRAEPGVEMHARGAALVFLNGAILGVAPQPDHLVAALRELRRVGRLGEFVHVHAQADAVHVSCDGGRVCRPLIICDRGVPRVRDEHIDRLKSGEWGFQDFLSRGLVEYLDVSEEGSALVAMYADRCTPHTTHLEIEPFAVMGVVAGLIPFPHHNQSPRNTYQCAMGKQAMGNIAHNQLARMDTLLYLLVYPQRPLLTTRTIELVKFDQLGAGQNAVVAVMSFTGYDIEDAIVMNRASLDRGFGRCIVLKKYGATLRRYPNRARDRIVAPAKSQVTQRVPDRFRVLDSDGLASPGEFIRPGDVYINMQRPTNTRDPLPPNHDDAMYRPTPMSWKGPSGERCVVDRVQVATNEEQQEVFKVLVRHTRRPELGDKFSSRHGQKGVVGVIVQQQDFPFSERGVCPDLVMNPHGFPSRMTVGKLIELLGSKAAVLSGQWQYGTAFGERSGLASRVDDLSEALVGAGYSYHGKDFLTSGVTGEPLEAFIFMGPVYYQKLKHMVLDKMHARAKGPRVVLTRQPTEGRSRDGGLRLGEMERDCLIAYGASMLLLERLMISSDEFRVHVDTKSGLLGHWDANRGCAVSPVDGSSDSMAAIKIPYACKLLFQELQSMNIVPRLRLAES